VTAPRRALVTGANRGLGRAVAAGLHALGHTVYVAARDTAAAERAAAALGPHARPVVLDIADEGSIDRARKATGDIDILVNNAGVLLDGPGGPIACGAGVMRRTFEVNAMGAWLVSQRYLPAMVEQGWGRVVMISSGTGAFSHGLHPATPAYSVSKAALNAVTVLLAASVAGTGVLVNAVNPGRVRTSMMPDATTEPDAAAQDVVWAATLPDGGPHGAFLRGHVPIDW
jgi:NAD(P)-dependent dehydrogenase (short-subunit alcohol dehydrogenase family)